MARGNRGGGQPRTGVVRGTGFDDQPHQQIGDIVSGVEFGRQLDSEAVADDRPYAVPSSNVIEMRAARPR